MANSASPAIVTADEFLEHEYDFIICGGGTAGLVLANRLTEDPNMTVGVIEAGLSRLDDPNIDIPAMCLGLVGNPEYDWIYKSVPQVRHDLLALSQLKRPGCQSGQSSSYPKRKGLGRIECHQLHGVSSL